MPAVSKEGEGIAASGRFGVARRKKDYALLESPRRGGNLLAGQKKRENVVIQTDPPLKAEHIADYVLGEKEAHAAAFIDLGGEEKKVVGFLHATPKGRRPQLPHSLLLPWRKKEECVQADSSV